MCNQSAVVRYTPSCRVTAFHSINSFHQGNLFGTGKTQQKHNIITNLPVFRKMSSANDEVSKAVEAASTTIDSAAPTIFDKIISGDIPCNKVYEDDLVLGFRDVNPQSPIHCLIIPKIRNGLTQLCNAQESHKDILGHLLYVAAQVAKKECPNGYRLVINDGVDGAQSVYHLHIHILGGRQMSWPPG